MDFLIVDVSIDCKMSGVGNLFLIFSCIIVLKQPRGFLVMSGHIHKTQIHISRPLKLLLTRRLGAFLVFLEEIINSLQFPLTLLLSHDFLCPGAAHNFDQRGLWMRFSSGLGKDEAVHEEEVAKLYGGLVFHGCSLL